MSSFEKFGWKILPKDNQWKENINLKPSYVTSSFIGDKNQQLFKKIVVPKKSVGRPPKRVI